MSLNSNDSVGAAGSGDRAPQLRAGGYAAWKPAMDVYLQRHGATNVHKEPLTEDEWRADCSDVAAWNTQTLAAARARARAAAIGGSIVKLQGASALPAPVLTADEKADRQTVIAHVERSHKAFGSIYSSLPEDLRLQVAHISQGWAYGLWMWLERKFQSTEADSVGVLLTRWVSLTQTEGESFDQYRARVNELAALLEHAKQKQTPEMYCLFLLKRLLPRYTSAVLALENGVMLKDLSKGTVDWDAVTALINNHERSERQFAEAAASGAKAMAAQAPSTGTSSSHVRARSPVSQERRGGDGGKNNSDRERAFIPMAERRCYNCGKLGHISRFCRAKKSQEAGGKKDEQVSSVQSHSASSPVAAKIQHRACGVSVKIAATGPRASAKLEEEWTYVQRKSRGGTAGNKKGKESPGAGKPTADTVASELQRATSAVSTAASARGDQSAVGTLAPPMPQAAIKNGVDASSSSSCTEASALAVSVVTSTVASPAASKSILKRKQKKKSVSFDMRRQPGGKNAAGASAPYQSNAQANAITAQLPREFGVRCHSGQRRRGRHHAGG